MIQLHYDATVSDAPVVTVEANEDGSANVTMDGKVVLVIKTPGDLDKDDIKVKTVLTIDAPAPAAPDSGEEAPVAEEPVTEEPAAEEPAGEADPVVVEEVTPVVVMPPAEEPVAA